MKLLQPFFLVTIIVCLGFACTPTRYTPLDFPDAQIRFGSGGGFTGVITEYVLLENGQLFKKVSTSDDYEVLPKLKKNRTKQIFNNYHFLNLQTIEFNQPGNLYHFIQFKNKNEEHRITWGDNHMPDQNVKLFNTTLQAIIK